MTISVSLGQPASIVAFRPGDLRPPAPPPRDADPGDLSATLASALDTLEDGLVVLTERGLVVHANEAARAMVAAGVLSIWNGQLCAAASADTRALRSAVATCAREASASLIRLDGADARRPLTVTLSRIRSATSGAGRGGGPLVVAVLRAESPAALPEPMLQALFGLTMAEARLAREVMQGDGLQACARRLGVAANTARTHLNRVFEKTGTKRQAELVRLLLGCRRS